MGKGRIILMVLQWWLRTGWRGQAIAPIFNCLAEGGACCIGDGLGPLCIVLEANVLGSAHFGLVELDVCALLDSQSYTCEVERQKWKIKKRTQWCG